MLDTRAVSEPAKPDAGREGGRLCITMRRQTCAGLSFRTSLERNAPESLTRMLYGFVHGHIWRASSSILQDGVVGGRFKRVLVPPNVNAATGLGLHKESRAQQLGDPHWVFDPFAVALAGTAVETNSNASSTAWPIGVGP